MKKPQLNLNQLKERFTRYKINGKWGSLLIAAGLGIASIVLVNIYLNQQSEQIKEKIQAQNSQPMITVVVANIDLKTGDIVTTDAVASRSVPKAFYESNAFLVDASDDLIGQKLAYPVSRGVPITRSDLDPAGKSFSNLVNEGKRAVTFQVDDTNSISTMLAPGNHVDLVLVVQKEKGDEVRPLLEDVTVIATGEETNAAASLNVSQQDIRRSYNTVTVQLDPESANKLILAQVVGKINVVLRGNSKEDSVKSPVVQCSDLLGYPSTTSGSTHHGKREDKIEMIVGGSESDGNASYAKVLGGVSQNKMQEDATKALVSKISEEVAKGVNNKQATSQPTPASPPQKKNFIN